MIHGKLFQRVGARSRDTKRTGVRSPSLRLLVLLGAVAGLLVVGVSTGVGATPDTPYTVESKEAPEAQATNRWAERTSIADDLDRDGVNDVFVGVLSEDVDGTTNAGRVYLLSGKTREILYRIESPEIQAEAKFGFFIQVLGDVNGDGNDDITIGTDAQDTLDNGDPCTNDGTGPCNEDNGKAWVFSGARDGVSGTPPTKNTPLYELENPHPQGTAGGVSATGTTEERNSARFGSRLARAGDVNNDDVPDVIAGASNNDMREPAGPVPDDEPGVSSPDCVPTQDPGCRRNEGEAFVFDGKNGALLRTLNLPKQESFECNAAGSCGTFGLAVGGPGDTDGDGTPDQLVAASSLSSDDTVRKGPTDDTQGRMYLFDGDVDGPSGASGPSPKPRLEVLKPDGLDPDATFGFQDAAPESPGDVNGDGKNDLYGNGFLQSEPGTSTNDTGRGWVFDGTNGDLLRTYDDPTPSSGGQFGFSMSTTDYDKDGDADVYIGQSPHHTIPDQPLPQGEHRGGTYVFDGQSNGVLKRFELPPVEIQPPVVAFGEIGPAIGWTSNAARDLNGDEDLNGDGEPDYVGGAPWVNVDTNGDGVGDSKDQGRLFVFLSAQAQGGGGGGGGGGDDDDDDDDGGGGGGGGNDNGGGDAGGAGPPPVTAPRPGRCANTRQGTAGPDILNGTTAGDLLLGLGGNDTMNGLQADDCLIGGPGKDRMAGEIGNDSLSGGSDADVLSGGAGNDSLSGGSGNDSIRGSSGKDRFFGGPGRDYINSADGRRRELVSCGSGRDTVRADAGDRIGRSCERRIIPRPRRR